jgi:hypothetical protein
MIQIVLRVLSGVGGLIAGLLAILVPLNFYWNLFSSLGAAQAHNNGQMGFGDSLGGAMIVLLFAAVFACISYVLLHFALARRESDRTATVGREKMEG